MRRRLGGEFARERRGESTRRQMLMNLADKIWRRVTSTRYSRALEVELLRERAEAVRLREEVERARRQAAQLRGELARETGEVARHVAEIHRLRAENRALLNSILGIAGVPPINVSAPLAGDIEAPVTGDVDAAAMNDAADAMEKSDIAFDEALASEGADMNPHFAPRPDAGPTRTAKPESPAPRSMFPVSEMLHGDIEANRKPAASAPESSNNFAAGGAPARVRFRRTTSLSPRNPRPVGPLRRRSWHQVNRLLEIEASRKPVSGE